MPHDKNGQEIKAGDRVTVECEVVSVCAGEYCTTTLKTIEVMPGNGESTTISAINAKQVVKVGLALLALLLLSVPTFAAERPPAFPTPPAFPACDAPGCTCDPCTCSPCDCLARAAVLLTVGVTGVPTDAERLVEAERRVAALERDIAELKAKLAQARAAEPFPKASAGISSVEVITPGGGRKVVQVEGWTGPTVSAAPQPSGGRYVTRQVCSNGTCRQVQEWVPDVQQAAHVSGDNFIDTDQQDGGGSPSGGGSCSSGSCGVRGGVFGNGPVLRVRGGPGLFRSIFGGCR